MSRIYDSWEKLVGAVLRREKDREIALRLSFSSSSSADFSSRSSFDSTFFFNPFLGDDRAPAGVDKQFHQAGPSNWDAQFQPSDHVISVSRSSGQKLNPADISSREAFFFRDVMAIEYEELKKATENFESSLLLGEGGFGRVYRGWIDEQYLTATKPGCGTAVAIKKMNHQGYQGNTEFIDEINYLSQVRHPDLIKLIGYSCDTDERVLVYEFMPKGSLSNHLFTEGHQTLPWATRIKVAIGAARALVFLHNLEMPVVHRNIKSGVILLDDDFNAKLSGFGFAIDGPTGDSTHITTAIFGTYGYAAPEYVATGNLNTISDVYGFGVLLLELMTGLRALDHKRPVGERNLVDWARPCLGDKRKLSSRVMDRRLEGQYPRKEAHKVAKIVLQCVVHDANLRPRMSEIVAKLEKL